MRKLFTLLSLLIVASMALGGLRWRAPAEDPPLRPG